MRLFVFVPNFDENLQRNDDVTDKNHQLVCWH